MKTIGILGNKWQMTQIISEKGLLTPVTPILVGNNIVSQVKTETKEGYNACQIAFGDCREKSLNKPLVGHLKKNNVPLKRHLREVRDMSGLEVGSPVDLTLFQEGDKVKVTGTSKGKGTAGVTKRYGYALGAMSHGGGYPHRLIGSMGGGRGTNQGVPKGKKMPGRMGHERVTQKAVIAKIDSEKQIIFVRGAVPGPKRGLVLLKTSSLLTFSKNDLIADLINLPEGKLEVFLPQSNFEHSKIEGLDWELKNFEAWELKNKLEENNYQLIKKALPNYWKRQEGGLEKTLERENLTLKITQIFTRKDKHGMMRVIRDEAEMSLLTRPFNFEFSISQRVIDKTEMSKFCTKNNPISIKIMI